MKIDFLLKNVVLGLLYSFLDLLDLKNGSCSKFYVGKWYREAWKPNIKVFRDKSIILYTNLTYNQRVCSPPPPSSLLYIYTPLPHLSLLDLQIFNITQKNKALFADSFYPKRKSYTFYNGFAKIWPKNIHISNIFFLPELLALGKVRFVVLNFVMLSLSAYYYNVFFVGDFAVFQRMFHFMQ